MTVSRFDGLTVPLLDHRACIILLQRLKITVRRNRTAISAYAISINYGLCYRIAIQP